MGMNKCCDNLHSLLGILILNYRGRKLHQDWQRVTEFIDTRDASYLRQLRALEVFMPDLNPALPPVYVGRGLAGRMGCRKT